MSRTIEHTLFLEAFAERKAPLTIIMGSGLSAPAGLPTWPALERKLREFVDQHVNTANQFGQVFKSPLAATLAKTKDQPWVAFRLIKEILGAPLFESLIARELTPSDDSDVPAGYTELLRLQPHGLITLNLDRFAGDAMTAAQARMVTPIYGNEIATKWNLIIGDKPHLVYLHGNIENPSTWVLTQDDLTSLIASPSHQIFLQSVFLNNLVLFVGVSADDAALSLRLLDLRRHGFRPTSLYWITTRTDASTEAWAEENYVKLIRYAAQTPGDHISYIEDFVSSCLEFSPPEIKVAPTENLRFGLSDPIDPDELEKHPHEEIRKRLSSMLAKVLAEASDSELYDVYRNFCNEYDPCVHKAFYRAESDKYRTWFDYKLNFPSTGQGNFGQVYHAIGPDGAAVAVKIMNEGVFSNNEMLGGFRRGVRSMQIINDGSLPGMVRMLESFEVPPTIIMPFLDGVSLQDALISRPDLGWITKLNIGLRIAEIVSSAHALAQTVLHRDLKPSNIMITNFEYRGEFDPEVVVLDFDMSWHKGSQEKDVIFESRDDFGFLCPEQTNPNSPYNARNTRVDSYGLGMTLYYMFGVEAPLANEPLSPLWQDRITRATRRGYEFDWVSAPYRLARLITRATKMEQPERIDFATMVRELGYIRTSVSDLRNLENVELWGEEILCRVGSSVHYHWDDITGGGVIESPSGVRVAIESDLKESIVRCQFDFADSGASNRSHLPRFLRQNVDAAIQMLRSGGWSRPKGEVLMGGLVISAEASVADLRSNLNMLDVPGHVFRLLMP